MKKSGDTRVAAVEVTGNVFVRSPTSAAPRNSKSTNETLIGLTQSVESRCGALKWTPFFQVLNLITPVRLTLEPRRSLWQCTVKS